MSCSHIGEHVTVSTFAVTLEMVDLLDFDLMARLK